MNELSERARELVRGLAKGTFEAEKTVPYCDLDSALGLSFAIPLIEQALLAERERTVEWAIAELDQCLGALTFSEANPDIVIRGLQLRLKTKAALRAAAETEKKA